MNFHIRKEMSEFGLFMYLFSFTLKQFHVYAIFAYICTQSLKVPERYDFTINASHLQFEKTNMGRFKTFTYHYQCIVVNKHISSSHSHGQSFGNMDCLLDCQ